MSIEMWTLATAIVTAVACALSGGLLLVKRDSMVSEGLSHAVLPGLAIGFLIFREYNSPWLIALATASGMLMVWLTSWLARTNLVDADAGLGIVFAGMFSVGVLIVSRYLRKTHFHADCIIEGNLALAPLDRLKLGGYDLGPRSWVVMLVILTALVGFLLLCFKELKITLFDSTLAARFQLRPALMQFMMLTLISLTTVAAFNVAGSILIVALMIAPPAAALLLTDRLSAVFLVSVGLAIMSAVLGFYLARSLDISPTAPIASVAGGVFLTVFLFAPERGLVATRLTRRRQREETRTLLLLDVLASHTSGPSEDPLSCLAWTPIQITTTLARLGQAGLVEESGSELRVTPQGHKHLAGSLSRMLSD